MGKNKAIPAMGAVRPAILAALVALAISTAAAAALPAQSCWAAGLEAAGAAGADHASGQTARKASIAKASFKAIGAQLYTGKKVKPKVRASYGGRALKEGRDFEVRYSHNRKVGTAVAKVTGTSRFKGAKTLKFKIARRRHREKVLVAPARTAYVPVTARVHYYRCSACGRLDASVATPDDMLGHLAWHWEDGAPGERAVSYSDAYDVSVVGTDVRRTPARYEWRWVAG